nr:unnamed protein product [Callosobruchus analis]
MDANCKVEQEIDNEDTDGADKTAPEKPAITYTMYGNDSNRIKSEDGSINNKDELIFEQIYVKVEPGQEAKNYGSNTTAKSNIILERMKDEIKYEESMQMSEMIKVENDDDHDVKVKMEMLESDTFSVVFDDHRNEKLDTKDKVDTSCIDIAEKMKDEIKYAESMQMSEMVNIDNDDDYDAKVKMEMLESDTDMNSVVFDEHLNEKLETKDQDDASCIDIAENELNEYVLQDGQGVMDMGESDYNYSIASDYSECASLSHDDKKVMEHFHSSLESKTFLKNSNLTKRHLGSSNLYGCTQCYTEHSTRELLDEHIIQNHPDLIDMIAGKVYECPNCKYKTSLSTNLTKHLLRKCEVTAKQNSKACIHCNATFKSKKMLNEHFIKMHPNLIVTETSTRFDCKICTFKTFVNSRLDEHMLNKHPGLLESDVTNMHECLRCNYKTTNKLNLDNHILRKHSDLSATISSKIFECTNCTYKTTHRGCLFVHKLKHPETAHFGKLSCIHCSLSFNNDRALDNHILKKHPDHSSDSKHKCTQCSAKFSTKRGLANHVLKVHQNSDTSVDSKIYGCPKCNYKSAFKKNLDEHVLRNHPDINATISSKIHVCTKCTYKTTNRSSLAAHEHPVNFSTKYFDIHKHSTKIRDCTNCTNKTVHRGRLFAQKLKLPGTADFVLRFNNDRGLDNHKLKKHPDYSSSIRSEIYECSKCTYKTTLKRTLTHPGLSATVSSNYTNIQVAHSKSLINVTASHMLIHAETVDNHKCPHCSSNFQSIRSLDDHVVKRNSDFISSIGSKKHPDLSESVSSKIHKCTNCTYKTTNKSCYTAHMLKHTDSDSKHKCTQCSAKFSTKRGLANHVLKSTSAQSILTYTNILPKYVTVQIAQTKLYIEVVCLHRSYNILDLLILVNLAAYIAVLRFNSDRGLDNHKLKNIPITVPNIDSHILSQHPGLSATVSSKIHERPNCAYKIANKGNLKLSIIISAHTAAPIFRVLDL